MSTLRQAEPNRLHEWSVPVVRDRDELSPNEYNVLQVLIRNAGSLVTHRQLLNEVWDPNT
jgi:DNA-binding response OmpR family regulator